MKLKNGRIYSGSEAYIEGIKDYKTEWAFIIVLLIIALGVVPLLYWDENTRWSVYALVPCILLELAASINMIEKGDRFPKKAEVLHVEGLPLEVNEEMLMYDKGSYYEVKTKRGQRFTFDKRRIIKANLRIRKREKADPKVRYSIPPVFPILFVTAAIFFGAVGALLAGAAYAAICIEKRDIRLIVFAELNLYDNAGNIYHICMEVPRTAGYAVMKEFLSKNEGYLQGI